MQYHINEFMYILYLWMYKQTTLCNNDQQQIINECDPCECTKLLVFLMGKSVDGRMFWWILMDMD